MSLSAILTSGLRFTTTRKLKGKCGHCRFTPAVLFTRRFGDPIVTLSGRVMLIALIHFGMKIYNPLTLHLRHLLDLYKLTFTHRAIVGRRHSAVVTPCWQR
jgi:hypothetical protein